MTNQTDLMPVEDLLLVANEVDNFNGVHWRIQSGEVKLFPAGNSVVRFERVYNPDAETYEGKAQKDRLTVWLSDGRVFVRRNGTKALKKYVALHGGYSIASSDSHTKCCLLAAAALIKGEEK